MKKFFKVLILFFYFLNIRNNFLFCEEKESKLSYVTLSNLNKENIESKRLYFRKLIDKSQRFKNVVYASGGFLSLGLITYLGFKIFGTEDQKKVEKEIQKQKEASVVSNFNYGLDRRRSKSRDIWELSKEGFTFGIVDGFYYGMSALIVSTVLGLQTEIFSSIKNKFVQLWDGQKEKSFEKIVRQLGINLEQLKAFFVGEMFSCDKQELKENYSIFIDVVETFMAFILEIVPDNPDSNYTIENLQELLFKKVQTFSNELEIKLNENDEQALSESLLNSLKDSFKHLNNQIVRFINLYSSFIYET